MNQRTTMTNVLVGVVIFAVVVGVILSFSRNSNASSTAVVKQAAQVQHTLYNPVLPAAADGSSVNVTLTAQEALLPIANGVMYHAYTFNGAIPGPAIHVRQGQTVHFTLVNKGTMAHSIDFHAAQTPWNVNYGPVQPGKSFSFDFTPQFPGVFMYHCGTPPVIEHIANGMYGAIIVDPVGGYPQMQELVLVQSEFYTTKQADGTYAFDMNKALYGSPDYVTFNGYANQYKDNPIVVKAGQPIRIFVVNAGPNNFSSFHVIGAIFSNNFPDGNPANVTTGNQSVVVPPGGATMVQLTIPDVGLYPFVTHSFADASKGALGLLKVTP